MRVRGTSGRVDDAEALLLVRNTATDEIIEIYPIGELPKSAEGIKAYEGNWRRQSAAEKNAKAGVSGT